MKIKDYTVTTKDGEKVLRSKCIRVKGEFYKRETDAIRLKIEGVNKWLSKTDDRVIFDEELGKFIDFHSARTNKRYVVFDIDYKRLTSEPDCNCVEALVNGVQGLATKAYAKTLTRDKNSGIYYNDETPQLGQSIMYRSPKYSYEQSANLFEKFKEDQTISPLNGLNPGYSFGVELETSKGMVPSDKLLSNGILPVRDGSTNNYEYVTVPLTNIDNLLPIVEALRKDCEFDVTTSLHCHIGNVPTDKEFISKFYRFMYNMQDQIFDMFPKYKHDNSLGIKRREYTQKLPNKVRFNTILNFLNNNNTCDQEYTGKMLNHSADVNRTNKWYISSRYYWVNLVPLIFYPSRTIEFRIHQGTLNKYKVIYWLLMCMALIDYVKNNKSTDKVSIDKVFNQMYDSRTSDALKLHYLDMCKYYKAYNEIDDPQYKQDTIDDRSYVPKIRLF